MKKPWRIEDWQKRRIVILATRGVKVTAIAERLGVSKDSVRLVLRRHKDGLPL